jgi:hypothetical protein
MDEKPAIAEPVKKRRWWQFKLRTVLIVILLIASICAMAAWIANQATVIRERNLLFENAPLANTPSGCIIRELAGYTGDDPLLLVRRRLFGDRLWDRIVLDDSASPEDLARFREAFGEARILTLSEAKTEGLSIEQR